MARDLISDMIVRLELRPGERLIESELQQRTGLGRTPIREALFQLVREGLVVKDARGFLVAELSADQVAELYEVREALEVLAVQRAVTRVREEDLQEFVRAVEVHGSVSRPEDRLRIGWQFHRNLAKLGGNAVLEELLEHVLRRIERIRFMEILSDPSGERAREEHRRILEAVTRRDEDAAVAAVRAHIRGSRDRVLNLFELKYQLARA